MVTRSTTQIRCHDFLCTTLVTITGTKDFVTTRKHFCSEHIKYSSSSNRIPLTPEEYDKQVKETEVFKSNLLPKYNDIV